MRAFADGTLPEPVGAHLAKLQDADLLVLSFPVWWFSMPAILKGWIDQVFLLSAIFGGGYGIFDEGGMTNKKAMMLLTTGGVEASFAPGASSAPGGYGDLNDFLYHVHRGMFEFVGYDVVHPFVTHAPVRLSDEEREQALAKARAYVTETLLAEPAAVR
jgi:NAD(P)H dehydrogenase (quinone)